MPHLHAYLTPTRSGDCKSRRVGLSGAVASLVVARHRLSRGGEGFADDLRGGRAMAFVFVPEG